MTKAKRCPLCGAEAWKVLYLGLPMHLCSDSGCSCGWGFWSWIHHFHFDGWFVRYSGSYWVALFRFLRGDFS
jgi:hypothetical protein